ncbi:hypothetical protein V2G26_020156 [Clonostachys chloroleuca]
MRNQAAKLDDNSHKHHKVSGISRKISTKSSPNNEEVNEPVKPPKDRRGVGIGGKTTRPKEGHTGRRSRPIVISSGRIPWSQASESLLFPWRAMTSRLTSSVSPPSSPMRARTSPTSRLACFWTTFPRRPSQLNRPSSSMNMSSMGTDRPMALESLCKDLAWTTGSQQEGTTGSSETGNLVSEKNLDDD